MLTTNFSEFFSVEGCLFHKLFIRLKSDGYVTDENFGVTRCLFESVSHRHFDSIFRLHCPGKSHEMKITSTAFRRQAGEFVYVVYDQLVFESLVEIENRLWQDGVLDIESESS
jgi:hypothetical protein